MAKKPVKRSKVKKVVSKKKVAKKIVKKSAKKVVKKTVPAKKVVAQKPVGAVTHFFGHISVAIVKFKQPVEVGARLKFKGATTDFEDTVKSMQYDHKPIAVAKKGQEVGIKVKKQVREGDEVFVV